MGHYKLGCSREEASAWQDVRYSTAAPERQCRLAVARRSRTHFSDRYAIGVVSTAGLKPSPAGWEAGMLRVVCGQCGKKLEIPDAWRATS